MITWVSKIDVITCCIHHCNCETYIKIIKTFQIYTEDDEDMEWETFSITLLLRTSY